MPAPGLRNWRHGKPQSEYGVRLRIALTIGCLAVATSGCEGAPSRNILGSYFPSWMVCALVGLVVALTARAIFKATGILQEIPAPLVVLLALGCAVTFGLWLLWLA